MLTFWKKKKLKLENFTEYYEPNYSEDDLDKALECILIRDSKFSDKTERYMKAATTVAERWRDWAIRKGIDKSDTSIFTRKATDRMMDIFQSSFDSIVVLKIKNKEFDVELGRTSYNLNLLEFTEFVKKEAGL